MSFLHPRPKAPRHARGTQVQARPAPPERTDPFPAARPPVHVAETQPFPAIGDPESPFTGKHARGPARPYVPELETGPLAGDIKITEAAVIGHLLDHQPPAHASPPLPRRRPGAHWPPAPLPLAREVTAGTRRLVALTGQPVPAATYPDPARDPGPARYAKLMRIISAATGTTSTYEDPHAWTARALTPGGTA